MTLGLGNQFANETKTVLRMLREDHGLNVQCITTACVIREKYDAFQSDTDISGSGRSWEVFQREYPGHSHWGWGGDGYAMVYWRDVKHHSDTDTLLRVFKLAVECKGWVSIIISKKPEVIDIETMSKLAEPRFTGRSDDGTAWDAGHAGNSWESGSGKGWQWDASWGGW